MQNDILIAGAAGPIGLEVTFNAAPARYTLGARSLPAEMAVPVDRCLRARVAPPRRHNHSLLPRLEPSE